MHRFGMSYRENEIWFQQCDSTIDTLLNLSSLSIVSISSTKCLCPRGAKLTGWMTCESKGCNTNQTQPSNINRKRRNSKSRRHSSSSVLSYQKDCTNCRSLTKNCSPNCLKRKPFVHYNDTGSYIKVYRDTNSTGKRLDMSGDHLADKELSRDINQANQMKESPTDTVSLINEIRCQLTKLEEKSGPSPSQNHLNRNQISYENK
uniref:Uncharacterized protein n=1 Tax=Clytia hemisphaerica TaxID=252671 RepID=A0A7M5XDB2_9CNID